MCFEPFYADLRSAKSPCCFKHSILHISALCRSVFGAFRIIILLHNERLLIVFLVLSYLSYVSASLLCYTFKRCLHTEWPQAQHPPTSTHYYESTSPPEVWDLLVSDAFWYHHREAQNHSPEHSHSPFLDGGIIFPPLSGMLDPCQSSSNNWRLISFGTTWLHPKLVH